MLCLSHETVLAFVEGSLPDGEAGAVDAHMDGCSSCRALVAELARAAPCEPPQGEPPPISASTIGPGDVLASRFCILRRLGRGAMGVVCEADDRELGVRVALKLLRHEAASSPRLLERLRKEAVLGRRVTHPNVCRLHDFGISDGVAFLSMELLEGETLTRLLAQGGLEPSRALALLEQIADALEAAHAHGVSHRDLKPSNIMVGANDKVSVMDFGLAHDLDADASEHGLAVGTPAYWSPEQARGEPATERSDIYSLGLIACELFGAQPRSTRAERLAALPPRYRAVVGRCLAEEPDGRFASVGEMRDALRAADRKRRSPFMRRRFAYGVAVAAVISALLVSVRPSAADQASTSLGAMAERTAQVSPPVIVQRGEVSEPPARPVPVVPPKRHIPAPPAASSAPPKPLPFFE